MASIFVAYKSEDRDRVRPIADGMAALGHSVFWDQAITTGETWRSSIGAALETAEVVIVCWSRSTQDHEGAKWVLDEVDEAARLRKPILPVLLDSVQPPLGHRQIQALDLSRWNGARTAPEFATLTLAVSEAATSGKASLRAIATSRSMRPFVWAALAACLVVVAVAGWRLTSAQNDAPVSSETYASTDDAGGDAPETIPPYDPRWLDERVASAVYTARSAPTPSPGYSRDVQGGHLERLVYGGAYRRPFQLGHIQVSFADGRRYEGSGAWVPGPAGMHRSPTNVLIHGLGVMWAANGTPLSQGRWEDGQLVEPFETPAGFVVGPMPFDVAGLHPSVAAAATQARNAPSPSAGMSAPNDATISAMTTFTCSEDGCLAFARLQYADGRIYEGAVEGDGRTRIVSLHGPGVMWTSDGEVAQSGVWHRSLLLQALQDASTAAVTPPRSPTRYEYDVQRQGEGFTFRDP